MNPTVWGTHVWKSIHYIALGLPTNPDSKDKEVYYDFFMNLAHVLPCKKCSDHLKEIYKSHPLRLSDVETASDLFDWTVKIHNEVNKKLNKPVMKLSDAKRLYTNTSVGEKNTKAITQTETSINKAKPSTCNARLALLMLCLLIVIIILNTIRLYLIK